MARAKRMGFYTSLSSNGALIDEANIDRIVAMDYDYVGISLDGIAAVLTGSTNVVARILHGVPAPALILLIADCRGYCGVRSASPCSSCCRCSSS